MITFDHTRYDVVGIAIQMGMSNNASILAIGMVDRNSREFISVPSSERNKVFPTRGCVFAYDFFKINPNWKNECVCLCTKPNNNKNIVDGEDYVWDWKNKEYIFADRLQRLRHPLGNDGQKNYEILEESHLLTVDKPTYFISGDQIYQIDPRQRLLPYWDIDSLSSSLYNHMGTLYLLKDIKDIESGKVDLTTDDQLIEWYKKNILRKEWNTIYETKNFNALDDMMTEEMKKLKIPSNVFKNRLLRIQSMTSNLTLTFEELESLSRTTWFSDVIKESIEKFSEKYVEKIENNLAEKLKDLRTRNANDISDAEAKCKSKMDDINLEIGIKKEELANLNSKIESESKEKRKEVKSLESKISELEKEILSKQQEIDRLSSRKDDIIADFSIIREVLDRSTRAEIKPMEQLSSKCEIVSIEDHCERQFPIIAPFRKNLESYIVKYLGCRVDIDEIVTSLATHNVLLLPDDATVNAIMHATRKCRYVVEYVGVDWKSFSDLWNNGLECIVKSATCNADLIHFLVLRDINMSFIPCYLHPVLDMQTGLGSTFPGTNVAFPENLRILCTRSSDTVIPVTVGSIEGIGCISPGDNISMSERKRKAGNQNDSSFANGYLPVSVFTDMPVDEKYLEKEGAESYLDGE